MGLLERRPLLRTPRLQHPPACRAACRKCPWFEGDGDVRAASRGSSKVDWRPVVQCKWQRSGDGNEQAPCTLSALRPFHPAAAAIIACCHCGGRVGSSCWQALCRLHICSVGFYHGMETHHSSTYCRQTHLPAVSTSKCSEAKWFPHRECRHASHLNERMKLQGLIKGKID